MNVTTFCYLIFIFLLCLEDFLFTHDIYPHPQRVVGRGYPLPTTHDIKLHSLMWSISQRCNMLAQIACLWQVNDIYCFLWSIFAERNRSCSRVSLFSKQFTACLFVRLNILSVDVSASKRSRNNTDAAISVCCFFNLASVSGWFQICRLPADPDFRPSGVSYFQVSRSTSYVSTGIASYKSVQKGCTLPWGKL